MMGLDYFALQTRSLILHFEGDRRLLSLCKSIPRKKYEMKNFLKWSLILAAKIFLSACNAVIVESYPSIPANYNEGYFGLAATKGAIATIVAGNPFSHYPGIQGRIFRGGQF